MPQGERGNRGHITHTANSILLGSLCPPTQGSIFADAKCCEQRRRQVAAEEQVPNSNSNELELHHALFLPPWLNSGHPAAKKQLASRWRHQYARTSTLQYYQSWDIWSNSTQFQEVTAFNSFSQQSDWQKPTSLLKCQRGWHQILTSHLSTEQWGTG